MYLEPKPRRGRASFLSCAGRLSRLLGSPPHASRRGRAADGCHIRRAKKARLLYCLLRLWNLFKELSFTRCIPKKGKADAKVTTSGHILQISGDFFFRAPGEPEGSFPKAGAKVGLITANAKLTGNFFGSFLDEKAQMAGKLGVRNEKKTKDGGKGERRYTIYNIIIRGKERGGTDPGW